MRITDVLRLIAEASIRDFAQILAVIATSLCLIFIQAVQTPAEFRKVTFLRTELAIPHPITG